MTGEIRLSRDTNAGSTTLESIDFILQKPLRKDKLKEYFVIKLHSKELRFD